MKAVFMKEGVIQFGEGGFLRAFADCFIDIMNEKELYDGLVTVVQPIPLGRLADLLRQDCRYNLILRGIEDGKTVNDRREIRCISGGVNPYEDFDAYLRLAENPDYRFVISNTTEAGIEYRGTEAFSDRPAASFPAKLVQLLYRRYELGLPGFIILSCELIDHNGDALRECCLKYARDWALGEEFDRWMLSENRFVNTLVDRITPGYPKEEAEVLQREIGWEDRLIDTAEPFGLWVIEGDFEAELPLQAAGLPIIWTADVTPYKKRKVRILNGAHTSLVAAALLMGIETVGEAMEDETALAFLKKCLFEEILPVIGETEDNRAFAASVLERFRNPFIRHRFRSIALNSVSKWNARVLPTVLEYREQCGTIPKGLSLSLAALIAFYRQDEPEDSEESVKLLKEASLPEILSAPVWETDLSFLFPEIEEQLESIRSLGMRETLRRLL